MTSAISRYHEFATLSQAAYAEFEDINDQDLIKKALQEPGEGDFTATQASEFTDSVTGYDVEFYQPTDAVDFSATLFRSCENPNEYTLAVRGIDHLIFEDLVNNTSVLTQGIGIDQLVSLFNLYQKLATPENANAVQLEVVRQTSLFPPEGVDSVVIDGGHGNVPPTYLYLRQVESVAGEGKIPEGATFNVVGHSLGGHLAAALSRLFGGRDRPCLCI